MEDGVQIVQRVAVYRYRRTKGPMVGAGSSWGSVLGPVAPSDDIDWYSSPFKGGQTIDKTPATALLLLGLVGMDIN